MPNSIIVPPETMNWIVDAIRQHCALFHDIKPEGRANLSKIGAALYGMNFLAANPTPDRAPPLPAYKFCEPSYVDISNKSAYQYGAVRLLRQRCDIDDLRKTTIFLALDVVYLRLALELADDHPETGG